MFFEVFIGIINQSEINYGKIKDMFVYQLVQKVTKLRLEGIGLPLLSDTLVKIPKLEKQETNNVTYGQQTEPIALEKLENVYSK